MTKAESFKDFAFNLAGILELSNKRAVKLAELIDDRIKELGEETARDSLDREFRRGEYDPDY